MIDTIGTVGANAQSAGLAAVGTAVQNTDGFSSKATKEQNVLGGPSVKCTDGEWNRQAGVLAKAEPRNMRLAERRNPSPGAQPPVAPPSTTADPLV